MLIALLAFALLGAPDGSLGEDNLSQAVPTWAFEDELDDGVKAQLRVHLTLPEGDRLAKDEAPVRVCVLVYPPAGVFTYRKEMVQTWGAGAEPLSFDVPMIYELGIAAGSLDRGYVEVRVPALGEGQEHTGEASVTLELPKRGPSSNLAVSTTFPDDSNSFYCATFRVVLPVTGIPIVRGRFSYKEQGLNVAVPRGNFDVRIEPQSCVTCGNEGPRPAWAQSSIQRLVVEGGVDQQLTHRFERGSSFNVLFLAPPGMEDARAIGTLRYADPSQDAFVQLTGNPRNVAWGCTSDFLPFPYLATTTDRLVYSREVFPSGEYVLSVGGESLETLEVPVTITEGLQRRRSFPVSGPLRIQLVRKRP